jgi:hypothetical protein
VPEDVIDRLRELSKDSHNMEIANITLRLKDENVLIEVADTSFENEQIVDEEVI